MNKAAFLDRDGVINQKAPEGHYVTRWEEMHFLPGADKAIALLARAGFRVIVVSNQRCVAKGLLTERELESLHQRMCNALLDSGAVIDGVYYCPHDKQPPCNCRKPAPGLLYAAARAHQIDLSASWMIGDSDIDVKAGRNAGCRTARVLGGNGHANGNGDHGGAHADIVAPSLLEAVRLILNQDRALTT